MDLFSATARTSKVWYQSCEFSGTSENHDDAYPQDISLFAVINSKKFNADEILGAHSYYEYLKTYLCTACNSLHSEHTLQRRLEQTVCPSCHIEATGNLLHERRGKCWRNCFACPDCKTGLAWQSHSLGFVLYCKLCNWDSHVRLNLTFSSPNVPCASAFAKLRVERRFFGSESDAAYSALLKTYEGLVRGGLSHQSSLTNWRARLGKGSYSPPNKKRSKLVAASQSLAALKRAIKKVDSADQGTLDLIDSISDTLALPTTLGAVKTNADDNQSLGYLQECSSGSKKDDSKCLLPNFDYNVVRLQFKEYMADKVGLMSLQRETKYNGANNWGVPEPMELLPTFRLFCTVAGAFIEGPPSSTSASEVRDKKGSARFEGMDDVPLFRVEKSESCTFRLLFVRGHRSRLGSLSVNLTAGAARPENGWFWTASLPDTTYHLSESEPRNFVEVNARRVPVDLDSLKSTSANAHAVTHSVWLPIHVTITSPSRESLSFWVVIFCDAEF